MYFDDFKLNDTFDIPDAVIEKGEMIEFARKYDNIPLHTDEEYAKTTRFGGLIAPGMMSGLSVWAKYLEVDLFGEELVAGKSTKVEWFRPVYPGDVLSSKGEISALTPRNGRNGIVEITINTCNQNGELVMKNTTEAVVRCRIN